MGNPCSLYDCMTPTVSGLRSLSLLDALSCAHSLGGFELGHFPTGMVTISGSEPKWAGDQKKSGPLRRAQAAQVPGEKREGHITDWFSW